MNYFITFISIPFKIVLFTTLFSFFITCAPLFWIIATLREEDGVQEIHHLKALLVDVYLTFTLDK